MRANSLQTKELYIDSSELTFQSLLTNNYIINGNFDIWQRGTTSSETSNEYFTADRWKYNASGGTMNLSQQTFTIGQTSVPGNPKYFGRIQATVADINIGIMQPIEGVNTLSGKTCTVSLWAKADTSRTLHVSLFQYFGSGGSPSSQRSTGGLIANISTQWTKYSFTFDILSISGETLGTDNNDSLKLYIRNPNNETFTFDIAQVKLEEGDTTTPFIARPIAQELALCQRYYFDSISDYNTRITMNGCAAGASYYGAALIPVTMRGIPTVTIVDIVENGPGFNGVTTASVSIDQQNIQGFRWSLQGTTDDPTGLDSVGVQYTADAEL